MATLTADSSLKVTIPVVKTVDGVTHYIINISLSNIIWSSKQRYSAFVELHQLLVANHGVAKDLLPPKKMIGNKEPSFVDRRRLCLQEYIKSIVSFMSHALPRELAEFLHLQHYEVTFLLQDLARHYFLQADHILSQSTPTTLHPLQLLAISERLKHPLPTHIAVEQQSDFSHVADFCSQLKHLIVEGSTEKHRSSNLVLNTLIYALNTFKNIETLSIRNANVTKIENINSIRKTLLKLIVNNSGMNRVADMLLCDAIHRDNLETTSGNQWPHLLIINFSNNQIKEIDQSIGLAPNVEKLNLSKNQLNSIENLTKLPHLMSLDLSDNLFERLENFHLKLGKIVDLDLSQNNLSSLEGLSKLYCLNSLNVSSNNISEVSSVNAVNRLPCLESLILSGNTVTTIVDYRTKILELFGGRAVEICLDNERTTRQELDKVAILLALRTAREGRLPTLDLYHPLPIPTSTNTLPYYPPDEAVIANETSNKDR